MADIERLTITLTAEMAQTVRSAVKSGEYASSSEIVREALREWRGKREVSGLTAEDIRALIAEGLQDIADGRVVDFDAEDIKRHGRMLLKPSEPSA